MMISFDFDGTLSRNDVQEYARELMLRGINVWICTSRTSPKNSKEGWNDDLFKVADDLGVSRDRIIFTNYANKSEFINNYNFIWHLDDCNVELDFINTETKTNGISVWGNTTWKRKCNKLLKI